MHLCYGINTGDVERRDVLARPAGSATTITATQLENIRGWSRRRGAACGWGRGWPQQGVNAARGAYWGAQGGAGGELGTRLKRNLEADYIITVSAMAACHCNWCCIRTSFTQLPQFAVVATSSWCCFLASPCRYCSSYFCSPGSRILFPMFLELRELLLLLLLGFCK